MQFIDSSKDPGVVEQATLSNGITLFHRKYTPPFGLPKIAASVLIMAGGRDDAKGKEGSAHFFEHMPFRGTKAFPTLPDLTHPIETNGGYINAFTTDEVTGYEVVVPQTMLEDAVHRIADMLMNPLMREEDIDLERQVIVEELRNKLSNVNFFARQHLFKGLLGDHPLVHAVIGTEEALHTITKQDLLAFHERYYNASNAYLFFAGEYDTDELIQLCEKYFGILPAGEKTQRNSTVTTPAIESYLQTFAPQNFNRSVYVLGRTLPVLNLDDMIKWRLYTNMLGSGMNSPLQQEIREKRGLAYGFGVGYTDFKDIGLFTFNVSSRFQNMDQIDTIFWEQATSIFDNQARFDEVKHMLTQQILFREYSVGALVDTAINSFCEYDKVIGINDYLNALEPMTLESVKKAILPYLNKEEFLNIRVNCDKDDNTDITEE